MGTFTNSKDLDEMPQYGGISSRSKLLVKVKTSDKKVQFFKKSIT